ncbi:MAG: hypothetical protein HXS54_16315 [Theionarchaea archaeon]|nr:hypothetical protein [Theionarchaea archaeon]
MTEKDLKRDYRVIYDTFWGNPRCPDSVITTLLGARIANTRMKMAYDCGYILGPQIRKKSYKNIKEYMYFINCKYPEHLYLKFREDPNVIYHAKTSGPCNMWIIAKDKMDLDGEVMVEGYHSDYYVSHAPDHTWERALNIMEEKINTLNPDAHKPQHIIHTHFDEPVDWDREDELLYRYFKYNLRKPFTPVMKEYEISRGKIDRFLNNLPETCTVFADYYPDSISSYDPYLFMIETDYEDFVIDLFSELPTTASFFKISGKLFLCIYIPKKFARGTDLNLSNKLYIPLILVNLLEKGIIKKREYVILEYSNGKNL